MSNTDRLALATSLLRDAYAIMCCNDPGQTMLADMRSFLDSAALDSLAPAAVEGEPVAYQARVARDGFGRPLKHTDESWFTITDRKVGEKLPHDTGEYDYRFLYTAAQVAALTAQCSAQRDLLRRIRGSAVTFDQVIAWIDAAGNGEGV